MQRDRVHVISVLCKRRLRDLLTIASALDPAIQTEEVRRVFGKLPHGPGSVEPELPCDLCERMRLNVLDDGLLVQAEWNSLDEDLVKAALENLVRLGRDAVQVDWRQWESAQEALVQWVGAKPDACPVE